MLEYIAQWVPHFINHGIVDESTSMRCVWQIIRQYYDLQQSEVHLLKLATIKWERPDKEHPKCLYRRILSNLKDNLLRFDSLLQHSKAVLQANEDISPTLERLAVLRWLELIDVRLPMLVARTFATDLQTTNLKDIQQQIANAMDSLLEQLHSKEAQVVLMQALQVDEDEIQVAQVYSRRQKFAGPPQYYQPPQQRNHSGPSPQFTNLVHAVSLTPNNDPMVAFA